MWGGGYGLVPMEMHYQPNTYLITRRYPANRSVKVFKRDLFCLQILQIAFKYIWVYLKKM